MPGLREARGAFELPAENWKIDIGFRRRGAELPPAAGTAELLVAAVNEIIRCQALNPGDSGSLYRPWVSRS